MKQFELGEFIRDKSSGFVITAYEDMIESNFEPWRPKEDELCWFWSSRTPDSATLAKFDKIIKIDHTWDIAYTEVLYKSKESAGLFRYPFCEPFIGKPPSFMKG